MDEEQSEAWPASDWDDSPSSDEATPSGDETPAPLPSHADQGSDADDDADQTTGVETSETEETTPEATSTDDARDESEDDAVDVTLPEPAADEPWTLPIRAAPILALQGEDVVEFPLSQHRSGLESTSLIMDEKLMRIVEARYDPDGVRRLNVRMALVKEHISGYSHTHLDLFQKLRGVWWGAIGFGLVMATGFVQGLLVLGGGAFVLTGIAGLLMAQLDLHRISFSDHGGRHDFYLSGWRQEPYLIHNSTALLGPAFVEFLRTASLDTQHIDAVIKAMGAPAQPAPSLASAPQLPMPAALPDAAADEPSLVPMNVVNSSTSQPSALPAGPAISGPPTSTSVAADMPPLPPPPGPATLPKAIAAPPPPALPAAPLPPPIAPVVLPPAPLPPAPLPPPPAQTTVDEDALWDELS
ncbi:MAG: hypothetical protein VX151_03170 [Candidatus Thermoplasmatota archaeon]|nr:hypothetical protein [Candidatus Thermoplasmatota archaeon]